MRKQEKIELKSTLHPFLCPLDGSPNLSGRGASVCVSPGGHILQLQRLI
jgi:hypothetical protein